jgi:hypothetical protein
MQAGGDLPQYQERVNENKHKFYSRNLLLEHFKELLECGRVDCYMKKIQSFWLC